MKTTGYSQVMKELWRHVITWLPVPSSLLLMGILSSWMWVACTPSPDSAASPSLLLYAGAASQPATEAVIQAFQAETGIEVETIFGGSGYVLSQMKLARRGDLYFPGSSDYMEIALAQGEVIPGSDKQVAYLVPAINVQAGNPKGIQTLADLLQPDLRVAIANPDGVCVGVYAVEILEQVFSPNDMQAFRANLQNYPESCAKTATAVSMKAVDAVLGWRVFQYWDSSRIETIPLAPEQVQRIGYLPIGISQYSQQTELAQRFIDYLLSPTGQRIFDHYHYFSRPEDATAWLGISKPIGGQYEVPKRWLP